MTEARARLIPRLRHGVVAFRDSLKVYDLHLAARDYGVGQ